MRVIINRNYIWLTFDNLRIENENGIEELEGQVVCFYNLTEPEGLIYGQQLVGDNNERRVYNSIEEAKQTVITFLKNEIYPPDYKHPTKYTKEDLSEIMNKTLIFDVGNQNSETIQEAIVGTITDCTLAGNPPFLPATVRITLLDGSERSYNFFEIKRIRR